MTIAERIHNGETAEEIGINGYDYDGRKATLSRFLSEHEGIFSEEVYLEWFYRQPETNPNYTHCDDCQKEIEATPLQMAGSALSAVGKFIGSGFKTVDDEEEQRRWGICEGCDYLAAAKENKNRRCTKCGCYMWLKVKIEYVHCNLNRW